MKTFLRVLFFAVLLLGRDAFAASAYDIEIRQRNSTNTQWEQKFITGSSGKIFGFTTSGVPAAITLGTNLTFDSGTNTLSASGGSSGLAVDTVAALKALSVTGRTTGDLLTLRGFYATNDGGQGTFVYNSSSTATEDTGLVVQPTTGSGRWLRLHTGVVNVKWFGAKGDGTTADWTPLQNALNAATAGGYAYGTEGYANRISTVIIPPGVYAVGSTLSLNAGQNVKIIGQKATLRASAAVPTLQIGSNTNTPENIEIEGLRLDANSVGTYGLYVRQGVFLTIRNVQASNYAFAGFYMDGADNRATYSVLFDSCVYSGPSGNGWLFTQSGNTSAFTHFTLQNCTVEGAVYGINSTGNQLINIIGGVYENVTSACLLVNGGRATLTGTFFENGNTGAVDIATVNAFVVPINAAFSPGAVSSSGTGGVFLHQIGPIVSDTDGARFGEVYAGEYSAAAGRVMRMGNSRTLNYLDTMLSHNLVPHHGSDDYKTHKTGSYAAMEFYYDGSTARGVRWYTSTSNGTAGTPMSLTPKMTLDSGGNLTVVGAVAGSNLSGSNTGDQNTFSNIIVGANTVSANTTNGNLTLVAGTGVSISVNNTTKTITFNATGAGAGDVLANGTLTGNATEGNIIIGNGGTTVRAAGITYNTTSNTLSVNSISTNTINANSVMVNNVMTGNVGGTGADNGSRIIAYGGNVTFNGSYTTQFNLAGNTALNLPTTGTVSVVGDPIAAPQVNSTNTTIAAGVSVANEFRYTGAPAVGAYPFSFLGNLTLTGSAAVSGGEHGVAIAGVATDTSTNDHAMYGLEGKVDARGTADTYAANGAVATFQHATTFNGTLYGYTVTQLGITTNGSTPLNQGTAIGYFAPSIVGGLNKFSFYGYNDIFSRTKVGALDSTGADQVYLSHDGDNGTVATNAGHLVLAPNSGLVSVVGVLAQGGILTPTVSSTDTLTNKRITARVTTITSSATPTINTDNCDAVTLTALGTAITSMTTNLTGTPVNFDQLMFRIKDDGTARAITWGASFEAVGAALPTTTTVGKRLTVLFIYDSVASKWGCVSTANES